MTGRGVVTASLDESVAYCKALTRRTAGNFYYSFLTLPRDLFHDMCVLYAFMRECDDIGDDEGFTVGEREDLLNQQESRLRAALDSPESAETPTLVALVDVVERKSIPHEYLYDVIAGIRIDLHPTEFATFEELQNYCYHVAGVVGLCCIHIWGFTDDRAKEHAVDCGTAFQLTNILRDLSEDAQLGRCYLPQEDLRRFGYSRQDIERNLRDESFRDLMTFEVERARGFYAKANALFGYLAPPGRPVMSAMIRIYGGLLDEIERCDFDVYSSRVRLPKWRKFLISIDETLRNRLMGNWKPAGWKPPGTRPSRPR